MPLSTMAKHPMHLWSEPSLTRMRILTRGRQDCGLTVSASDPVLTSHDGNNLHDITSRQIRM